MAHSALADTSPRPHVVESATALATSSWPSHYVLIDGSGRSGTNWLLESLNWSPRTHCRNEPHALPGGALAHLPDAWVITGGEEPELDAHWDAAVRQCALSFGVRDHPIPVRKPHFRALVQQLGMPRPPAGARTRRILGPLLPPLRKSEWRIPRWMLRSDELPAMLPVLKINRSPRWMVWALKSRPQARVLQIVRHPGGFLNSYKNRWLALQPDHTNVLRDNRDRLAKVAHADLEWAARFGDIEAMPLLEAELWYWRYDNESVHNAGATAGDRYRLIIYEHMVGDPIGTARSIYGWLGLDWTPAIENAVAAAAQQSESISKAWRTKLPPNEVALVERVLANSPMRGCWPD